MAQSVITVCDFRRHQVDGGSRPTFERFEGVFDGEHLEADVCTACIGGFREGLLELGVRPSIALVDGKPRREYRTATGARFTMAEAREWLADEGYDVPTAGRIRAELMEKYAAAH